MQKDINNWITRCPQCQFATGPDKIIHKAPMKPLDILSAFSRWHLDFIGELPITKNNSRWILAAVDHMTRGANFMSKMVK